MVDCNLTLVIIHMFQCLSLTFKSDEDIKVVYAVLFTA